MLKILFPLLFTILISCADLPEDRDDVKHWLKKPLSKQLRAFKSDGCSLFPEGNDDNHKKWLRCCVIHDYAYWKGGNEKQKIKADKELARCVGSKDETIVAKLMHIGVSVGGHPGFDTYYTWAFGWNYNRGYLDINKREQEYIDKISPKKGESLKKFIDLKAIDPLIKKSNIEINF